MAKSKIKSESSTPIELSLLAEKIRTGQLQSLPEKIQFNLKSASLADYEALLELARYASWGAKALKTQPNLPKMQKVRELINAGSFSQAKSLVDSMDPLDAEVKIEQARCDVFLGDFEAVPSLLASVINDGCIGANTRGVASQLSGHAFMELGELDQASAEIARAIELAKLSGNTLGLISAQLFLSKIFAFKSDFLTSELLLAQSYELIRKIGGMRWYLAYYRHSSHAHYLARRPDCINEAHAAIQLARSIGDELFECRGIVDLSLMLRMFNLEMDFSRFDPVFERVFASKQSDLRKWVNAARADGEPPTYTAKTFIGLARPWNIKIDVKLVPSLENKVAWIYDQKNLALIDLQEAEVVSLPQDSPVGKILVLLNLEPRGMDSSDLFERIWNLKWKVERHKNVLDVTLHRVNKLSPCVKLVRAGGKVKLSQMGLVL